jgi:hypothetical protein
MVPEDLLSVNNLGTNFKLSIKGSGSSVISFLKARKGIKKDDILPAKDLHVALYLASLAQLSRTPSPVIQAFYSIRMVHCVISVTYVKKNIYKYAYHEKRNLQYAIYTIYKYAHDENMKYNINQMYI